MNKKFTLFLAALLMGLTVQATAWAQDYDEYDEADTPDMVLHIAGDDDADADDEDADAGPFHWRGRGHGPAMMPGMKGMKGMPCMQGGETPCMQGMQGMRGGPGKMGKSGMSGRGGRSGMMGMRGHGGGFGMFGPMGKELGLTESQKTQMIDVMVDNYRQRLMLRMEENNAFQKLAEQHQSENPDKNLIVSLNTTLGELKGKRAILRHQAFEKYQNILTPEQREKVKEFKDKFQKMREERGPGRNPSRPMGPKGMRGPGPKM